MICNIEEMKTLNISDHNFQRLQAKSRPLIDTADDVVGMLLDFHDMHAGKTEPKKPGAETQDETPAPVYEHHKSVYGANDPPSLRFAEVEAAYLNGKPIAAKGWNPIFFEVIRQASARLGERVPEYLNTKWAKTKSAGLAEIPGTGIYMRGGDSDFCWRSIVRLARAAKFTVAIDFEWPSDQLRSAYPGRKGRLECNEG